MDAIFSSKLYKASPRKERIQAALSSLGNVGLVQQLAENLDSEYRTAENLGLEKKVEPNEESTSLFVDEEINPETDLVTIDDLEEKSSGSNKKPSAHHKSNPVPSGSISSLNDNVVPEGPEGSVPDVDSEVPEGPEEKEPKTEEAEASTKIQSCTQINLSVLKDSLNSREDTHGVSRIAEKENEVWIYYKDDINLNNIMTEVIEYMMISGYSSLEFNRLARSDNAIVFQEMEGATLEIPEEKPQDKSEVLEDNNLEEAPEEFQPDEK